MNKLKSFIEDLAALIKKHDLHQIELQIVQKEEDDYKLYQISLLWDEFDNQYVFSLDEFLHKEYNQIFVGIKQ